MEFWDLAAAPPVWEDKVRAAVLAAGGLSRAMGHTAVRLRGLDRSDHHHVIELVVPVGHGPVPAGVIVHRTRRIDPALTTSINGARSGFEVIVGDVLKEYGVVPLPVRRPLLRVPPDRVFELDLAYIDLKIDIEAMGAQWHSTPQQRRQDRERRRILESLGWIIIEVTWSEAIHTPRIRAEGMSRQRRAARRLRRVRRRLGGR